MTEFEFLETFAIAKQDVFNNFVVISTVIFAYLAAGHFIARDLSTKIMRGLTLIYCFFLIAPMSTYWLAWSYSLVVIREYESLYPDGWLLGGTGGVPILLIFTFMPIVLAWLGSIYYVHYIVRKDANV